MLHRLQGQGVNYYLWDRVREWASEILKGGSGSGF